MHLLLLLFRNSVQCSTADRPYMYVLSLARPASQYKCQYSTADPSCPIALYKYILIRWTERVHPGSHFAARVVSMCCGFVALSYFEATCQIRLRWLVRCVWTSVPRFCGGHFWGGEFFDSQRSAGVNLREDLPRQIRGTANHILPAPLLCAEKRELQFPPAHLWHQKAIFEVSPWQTWHKLLTFVLLTPGWAHANYSFHVWPPFGKIGYMLTTNTGGTCYLFVSDYAHIYIYIYIIHKTYIVYSTYIRIH